MSMTLLLPQSSRRSLPVESPRHSAWGSDHSEVGNDCCLVAIPRNLRNMADEIESYRLKIAELQEENTALREAARTFGDLAERLNQELKEERRRNKERRSQTRNTPERRQLSFHNSK
jgi:regulator of replication initiation timing